mmetsp:Transcript_3239/g.12503  ORF Transcript_3239/g.12503 Transcript_3239/m.12503 type:complete len:250 (-) Transcript_3239:299-1048(-)
MSCRASHSSGELSLFAGRLREAVFASSKVLASMPERPLSDAIPPAADGPGGGKFLGAGLLLLPPNVARAVSFPEIWSTSFIDSDILFPLRFKTLTNTLSPRLAPSFALFRCRSVMALTCTKPSALRLNSTNSTKAPKSITFVTLPRYTPPTLGSPSRVFSSLFVCALASECETSLSFARSLLLGSSAAFASASRSPYNSLVNAFACESSSRTASPGKFASPLDLPDVPALPAVAAFVPRAVPLGFFRIR